MIHEKFNSLVKGKSIALIGGGKADEERAARADIVARCNLFINEGQRCDMAWLAGNAPDEMPKDLKAACINLNEPKCIAAFKRWPSEAVIAFGFHNSCYRLASPHGREQEWLSMFSHQLGTMPLCGILAARYLTLCDIKSLYVTGFDFYIEQWKEHQVKVQNFLAPSLVRWQRGPHWLTPQLEWLMSLEEFDYRVTLDIVTHEVARKAKGLGLM